MAKTLKNNGKQWTDADVSKLEKLVKGNIPTGLIAHQLGRSEDAVRSKASELEVSLKQTNQSPNNKLKK